ncbi:MAG: SDR family NAD(P)-dependent oxidoreductase, partial [Mesorhizobium sp.]
RDQIETNVFGALWVTQAALPIMRAQRSGHIIQISSIGGVNAFASIGLYHASKWALEAFSQSLSQEVAQFGILPMIRQEYANRIAIWEKWDHVSVMAQGANKNRKG